MSNADKSEPNLGMAFSTAASTKAGELLSVSLGTLINKIWQDAEKRKDAKPPSREEFQTQMQAYRQKLVASSQTAKTILNRDSAVNLTSIFVKPSLDIAGQRLEAADLDTLSKHGPRILVVGEAGSGKSTLLKYLAISLANSDRFPLLLNCRSLPEDGSMIDAGIRNAFGRYGEQLSTGFIDTILSSDDVVLFLDGFDEVSEANSAKLSEEIEVLASRNRHLPMYLTSREYDQLPLFPSFVVARVSRLKPDQVDEIIEKAPISVAAIKAVQSALKEARYASHIELLATPLLVYILILVFKNYNYVPESLTQFYGEAFRALFEGHDHLKEGRFRRETDSKLTFTDYRKLYSAFCARSLCSGQLKMPRERAEALFEESSNFLSVRCNPSDVVNDTLRAWCVLVKDGADCTFPHKSFQEFYAAVFFCEYASDDMRNSALNIKRVPPRHTTFWQTIRVLRPDYFAKFVTLPCIEADALELVNGQETDGQYIWQLLVRLDYWFEVTEESISIHHKNMKDQISQVSELVLGFRIERHVAHVLLDLSTSIRKSVHFSEVANQVGSLVSQLEDKPESIEANPYLKRLLLIPHSIVKVYKEAKTTIDEQERLAGGFFV